MQIPANNMKVKVAEQPLEADKLSVLLMQFVKSGIHALGATLASTISIAGFDLPIRGMVKDQWSWIVITCILVLSSFLENFIPFYGGNIIKAILSNKSFTSADQLKLIAILISVGPLSGVARWLIFDMAGRTSHGMGNIIDKKEVKIVESLFTYYLFGGLKYTATTLFAFSWMCNISSFLSMYSLVVIISVFIKDYVLPILITRPQVRAEDFLTFEINDGKKILLKDVAGSWLATMLILGAGIATNWLISSFDAFRPLKLLSEIDPTRLPEFMIHCSRVLCALFWIGRAIGNGKKEIALLRMDRILSKDKQAAI